MCRLFERVPLFVKYDSFGFSVAFGPTKYDGFGDPTDSVGYSNAFHLVKYDSFRSSVTFGPAPYDRFGDPTDSVGSPIAFHFIIAVHQTIFILLAPNMLARGWKL